jgi:hypothetical protein
VRFALEDVQQVRERRLALGRTALLTIGVLYAVGFVLIIESGALALGL